MKKTMKNVTLTLFILTLTAVTILMAYFYFFASGDRNLSGEWTAELNMTQQAAVTALGWLQDMEAVTVSLEDMQSCMQDLTIQVSMTMEQTDRSGGTFHCTVSPESYDACKRAAYESFAKVFRELLAERLHMAGYGGNTDGEAVEALVTETFGMPTVSYLMAYGPALLPPLEELQVWYEGSGIYEISEGVLTRQYDMGGTVETKSERYIRQGISLILSEETGSVKVDSFFDRYPVIYTKGAGKENP